MTSKIAAGRGCPICAIAAGRAAAHIVYEDDRLVAFLDIAPIRPGHLQIVPRAHFPHFNALPTALAGALLTLGQRLADGQRAAFRVDRVGFLFPAGEASHAQLHAVPLLSAGDVTARRTSGGAGTSAAELAQAARLLRRELAGTAVALSGHGSNTPGYTCGLSTI
jgi:histidine triad (HIT) family protein